MSALTDAGNYNRRAREPFNDWLYEAVDMVGTPVGAVRWTAYFTGPLHLTGEFRHDDCAVWLADAFLVCATWSVAKIANDD